MGNTQKVTGNTSGGDAPSPDSLFAKHLGPDGQAAFDEARAKLHDTIRAGSDKLRSNAPSPETDSLYDQWRAHQQAQPTAGTEPTIVKLPSGMRVRARRPHLLALLRSGRIPDTLTPRVNELIAIAQNAGEEGVAAEMTREQADDPAAFYANWTKLLDIVWLEAVQEPVFVAGEPKEGQRALPVSGVSDADKTFLFMWAQGADQTVADFLDRNARAAAPVGDSPLGD